MAAGYYSDTFNVRREVVEICGKFYPQGAGTPLLDTLNPPDTGNAYPVSGRSVGVKGVASVSRTSAGLYVLTLQDKYAGLLSAQVAISSSVAVLLGAQIQGADVAGAKTVTILTQTFLGVATDLAINASNWVSFILKLARSPTI